MNKIRVKKFKLNILSRVFFLCFSVAGSIYAMEDTSTALKEAPVELYLHLFAEIEESSPMELLIYEELVVWGAYSYVLKINDQEYQGRAELAFFDDFLMQTKYLEQIVLFSLPFVQDHYLDNGLILEMNGSQSYIISNSVKFKGQVPFSPESVEFIVDEVLSNEGPGYFAKVKKDFEGVVYYYLGI